jgi:hypothetical protein
MGELSLNLFQAGLKGRVRGNLVRFAGPEAAGKKGNALPRLNTMRCCLVTPRQ